VVPEAEKHWLGASLFESHVPFTGALPAVVRGSVVGGRVGAVVGPVTGGCVGVTPVKRIEGSRLLVRYSIIRRTDPSSGGRMLRSKSMMAVPSGTGSLRSFSFKVILAGLPTGKLPLPRKGGGGRRRGPAVVTETSSWMKLTSGLVVNPNGGPTASESVVVNGSPADG
jgi:hypothetical protein